MERGKDCKPVVNENTGEFVGFNLGADFTAEHECGFGSIKRAFGIYPEKNARLSHAPDSLIDKPKPPFGLDQRRIHQLPLGLTLSEHVITPIKNWRERITDELKPQDVLYLRYHPYGNSEPPTEISRALLPIWEWDVVTGGWSDSDFGVVAAYDELEHMKELFEAFQQLDIIIGLFGGRFFQNSGLGLYIASRIPEEIAGRMHDEDVDHYNLLIAAEETGIYGFLKEADKKYFALSPRWAKDIEGVETAFDVVFWLNPYNQQRYRYGWFTIEALQAWAKDEGPILIQS